MLKYLFTIIFVASLWACSNDTADDVYPTNKDKNWFSVQDKPGALNQALYRVYKNTGCPIFINDTLGSEDRGVDRDGNPIIYYELLRPGNNLSSGIDLNYALSRDSVCMLAVVELLERTVLPELQKIRRLPMSIFLVDTLYVNYEPRKADVNTLYRSAKTITMGLVQKGLDDPGDRKLITLQPEFDQRLWAYRLLAMVLREEIRNNYATELKEEFAIIAEKANNYPNFQAWGTGYESMINQGASGYDATSYKRSFLGWSMYDVYIKSTSGTLRKGKKLLSYADDITDYMAAVFAFTPEEFSAKFENETYVMQKYNWMRDLLLKAGYLKD